MDTTQQILEAIMELRRQHPSWRFGQLVANVSFFAKGPTKSAVYDVEDEEFLKAAQSHLVHIQEEQRETVAA
jgi:hypothetical protein